MSSDDEVVEFEKSSNKQSHSGKGGGAIYSLNMVVLGPLGDWGCQL